MQQLIIISSQFLFNIYSLLISILHPLLFLSYIVLLSPAASFFLCLWIISDLLLSKNSPSRLFFHFVPSIVQLLSSFNYLLTSQIWNQQNYINFLYLIVHLLFHQTLLDITFYQFSKYEFLQVAAIQSMLKFNVMNCYAYGPNIKSFQNCYSLMVVIIGVSILLIAAGYNLLKYFVNLY